MVQPGPAYSASIVPRVSEETVEKVPLVVYNTGGDAFSMVTTAPLVESTALAAAVMERTWKT